VIRIVQARIGELLRPLLQEADIETKKVLRELARVVYFDVGRLYDQHSRLLPIQEWPEEARVVVQSVTHNEDGSIKSFTVVSKADAIGRAMKYLQLLEGAPKIVHQQVTPDGIETTTTVPYSMLTDHEIEVMERVYMRRLEPAGPVIDAEKVAQKGEG
jgi:hypothetical protein